MLQQFSVWLRATQLSWLVTHYNWIWPAAETLHFVGLCLLLGIISLIDLRMLGMLKSVPFAALHRLVPWGILGFALNAVTGILFFVGTPYQYVDNPAFFWKMVFMLLAGVNVLGFYLTVFKDVEALGPGDDAPMPAKLIAGLSIFLWLGVIFFGRMLPYIGNSF